MHSATWDASYDLSGKTVAVIGGASSAAQIIPNIQPSKIAPYRFVFMNYLTQIK